MSTRVPMVLAVAIVASHAAFSVGCDSAAVVKIELANSTATTSAITSGESLAPTEFAIRLSRIYLSESVNAAQLDTGSVSVVWQNRCKVASGGACFVDLARTTAEINADLHADPTLTTPGTYRYVRLEMCRAASAPNVLWRDRWMPGPRALTHEYCAVTSKPFDPPIILGAGDTASIALSYDLSSMIATLPAGAEPTDAEAKYIDCAMGDDGEHKTCVFLPTLTPSVAPLR